MYLATFSANSLTVYILCMYTNIALYWCTSVGSRQTLWSATHGNPIVSPTVTHFGARSFVVAGHKAWNQLPADIHAIDSVNSF